LGIEFKKNNTTYYVKMRRVDQIIFDEGGATSVILGYNYGLWNNTKTIKTAVPAPKIITDSM
jgi:hypothetical protein